MWFLVAIMTMVHDGDAKDVYIWSEPRFETSEQCLDYVRTEPEEIYLHLMQQFPADKLDRLFCVQEERLRKFLKEAPVVKKEESI
jgi:hypothetical protein